MKKLRLPIIIIAIIAAVVAALALRPKPYVIVDVPGYEYVSALGVNSRGQVIISADTDSPGPTEAYLWERGKTARLGAFTPVAINDAGDVAGNAVSGPVLWRKGALVSLTGPGIAGASVIGISQSGEVMLVGKTVADAAAGYARLLGWLNGAVRTIWQYGTNMGLSPPIANGSGVAAVPYLLRNGNTGLAIVAGRNRTAIPLLPGTDAAYATAIGGGGDVAYWPGSVDDLLRFVWSARSGLRRVVLPKGKGCTLNGFTTDGTAFGILFNKGEPDVEQPVVWKDGKFTDLPTDGLNWEPLAANDAGMVVGTINELPRPSLRDRLLAMFHRESKPAGAGPLVSNSSKAIIWTRGVFP